MGIKEILEKLRDGLANDASLKSYCQTEYGKDQTVFLGLDKRNPPKEHDTPVIIIAYVEKTEIIGNRKKYRILIGYSITKITIIISGNKTTYEGFPLVEELREKSETVLLSLRKSLGKIDLESAVVENSIFPQFTASTFVNIEIINSSRS